MILCDRLHCQLQYTPPLPLLALYLLASHAVRKEKERRSLCHPEVIERLIERWDEINDELMSKQKPKKNKWRKRMDERREELRRKQSKDENSKVGKISMEKS